MRMGLPTQQEVDIYSPEKNLRRNSTVNHDHDDSIHPTNQDVYIIIMYQGGQRIYINVQDHHNQIYICLLYTSDAADE